MGGDPIRELLAGLSPALFLDNPSGTVAFWRDRVVDAGGDPDEVLAWVQERGGYLDKSFAVSTRKGFSMRVQPDSKQYYVVPEDALA